MSTLLSFALSNVVVALAMAVIAAGCSRFIRRPALRHALWLLVLLKLVTPPIWHVPVAFPPPAASPVVLAPEVRPEPVPDRDLEKELAALLEEHANLIAEVPAVLPAAEPLKDSPLESTALWTGLAMFWLAGTLIWLAAAWRRVRRFQRLLQHGQPASPALQTQAAALAVQMGLSRCPGVKVLPGQVAPMLWGMWPRPLLLVPTALIERLSIDQQATLLAHELAHYRRRDHWVRWLEMLVMALYWWFPLVWWARRELREAEEECCDAWVVWLLPSAARSYADALVETLDFLGGSRAAVPLVASGLGNLDSLRRRLTMIMRGGISRSLTGLWLLGVLGLAGILLPLGATSAVAPTPPQDPFATIDPEEQFRGFGGEKQEKGKKAQEEGSTELYLAKLRLKVEEAKVKLEESKAKYEQRVAEYHEAVAQTKAGEKKGPDVVRQVKGNPFGPGFGSGVKGEKGEKAGSRLDEIERKLEGLIQEIRDLRKSEKKGGGASGFSGGPNSGFGGGTTGGGIPGGPGGTGTGGGKGGAGAGGGGFPGGPGGAGGGKGGGGIQGGPGGAGGGFGKGGAGGGQGGTQGGGGVQGGDGGFGGGNPLNPKRDD